MSFFKTDNAVIKKMAILQEFRISSKNSRSFYKNSSSLEGRTGKVGSLFVNPLYVLPFWWLIRLWLNTIFSIEFYIKIK